MSVLGLFTYFFLLSFGTSPPDGISRSPELLLGYNFNIFRFGSEIVDELLAVTAS